MRLICALDHLRDLGEEKRSVEKRVRGFGEHLVAFLRRGGCTSVGARVLEHGGYKLLLRVHPR